MTFIAVSSEYHESGLLISLLMQIKLTEDHMWLGRYGCLFQRLCSTRGEVPIGMLRTEVVLKV